MREIKFRAKTIKTNRWAYGCFIQIANRKFFIQIDNKDNLICETFDGKPIIDCLVEVKPETVGQLIGVTDKHGKDIYEGDIVNLYLLGKVFSAAVRYSEERSCFEAIVDDFGASDMLFYSFDINEVIGNIHDNPELLEEAV